VMETGFNATGGGERRGPGAAREAGDEERRFYSGPMPPEFAGGLGDEGAAALKEFLAGGGTVLAFNRASNYAIQQLGAGARNVLAGATNRDFYAPGSLFNTIVETKHPLTFGMEKGASVWFESGPAFEPVAQNGNPAAIPVLSYPAENPLASGWLL